MNGPKEFEEIAHAGGKVTITVADHPERGRGYQVGYRGDRPNAFTLVTLYALPPGLPIEMIPMGGLGTDIPPPSVPGSFMIFLASDREGWFGRSCASCDRYWRAETPPSNSSGYCPYCGAKPSGSLHLTEAQNSYVAEVCGLMRQAMDGDPGTYEIDLDAVADAVGETVEKPPFYYSEERQQTKAKCEACGYMQDIIGLNAYCCVCNTRTDLLQLQKSLDAARGRGREDALEGALRDAISAFDGFVDTIAAQLVRRVPMTRARAALWEGARAKHKIEETLKNFDSCFGFRTVAAVTAPELALIGRLVGHRHVHEHKGGIVDQRYIDETGDQSVRVGQQLREDKAEVLRLTGLLAKIAAAVSAGFGELFPPDQRAIDGSWRKPKQATPSAGV